MHSTLLRFSEKARGLAVSFSGALEKARLKAPLISRVPKKIFWIVLIVVLAAGIGTGTYAAVSTQQSSTATTEAALQTATARQGDLILEASGTGYLVAFKESLGFNTSGKLTDLYVKLGDTVEEGQLLAQKENTSEQAALDEAKQALQELTSPEASANARLAITSAQADIVNAQIALNNLNYWQNEGLKDYYWSNLVIARDKLNDVQGMYDAMNVGEYINNTREAESYKMLYAAQKDYDLAKYYHSVYSQKPPQRKLDEAQATLDLANARLVNAQNYLAALKGEEIPEDAAGSSLVGLRQAQLALQTAQEDLDATKLYTPISGVVMTLTAEVGETVSGTIMTIDDLSQATIQFYMDESDWGNIKVGYEVAASFDALPNQSFSGVVTEVQPGLVTAQGSSVVEGSAELDSSIADIGLPIGVEAAIDVISGQATNAVLVPVEALHELSDGSYTVFVMVDGTPTMRVVEVGLQSDTFAEITSGVNAGDIVTTGIVETSK